MTATSLHHDGIAIRLPHRTGPGGLILLYHRVARLDTDPQLMAVTPEHFAEHLDVLSRHYRPVRLADMVRAIRQGRPVDNQVALTFDDGYLDNLTGARPLLERYGVPATVYVATGHLQTRREYWWDELERILLTNVDLPESLQINIAGRDCDWELGESAKAHTVDWDACRDWNVLIDPAPTRRHRLYRWLHRQVRPHHPAQRDEVLDALRSWAGRDDAPRPTHRACSPAELRDLADGGLVEVGAHTVTHPVLSGLTPDEQETEIRRSRACLEDCLDREVTSFSYPFGTRSDYNTATIEIVQRCGFDHAVANEEGRVHPGSDGYQLPRILTRDWDGDAFAARLRMCMGTANG